MDVRILPISDFGGTSIVGVINSTRAEVRVYFIDVKLPVIGQEVLINKLVKYSPKQYRDFDKGAAVIWFEDFIQCVVNQCEFPKNSNKFSKGVYTIDKQRISEMKWCKTLDDITEERLNENF